MKLSYKICDHFPAPLSLEAKDLMLHAEGLESENDELKARVKELEDFLEYEEHAYNYHENWWETRLERWKRKIAENNDE